MFDDRKKSMKSTSISTDHRVPKLDLNNLEDKQRKVQRVEKEQAALLKKYLPPQLKSDSKKMSEHPPYASGDSQENFDLDQQEKLLKYLANKTTLKHSSCKNPYVVKVEKKKTSQLKIEPQPPQIINEDLLKVLQSSINTDDSVKHGMTYASYKEFDKTHMLGSKQDDGTTSSHSIPFRLTNLINQYKKSRRDD